MSNILKPTNHNWLAPLGGWKVIPLAIVFLLGASPLFLTLYSEQAGGIGGIYYEDIFLTSVINEQGLPINPQLSFAPTTPLIYCVITSRGMLGMSWSGSIILHWYYEDKEITTHLIDIYAGIPATSYLEPLTNQPFREGHYSVTLQAHDKVIKMVEFEVK